jgi:hypothetical protein
VRFTNKHVYLPIALDFSVRAVNEMIRVGKENDLGAPHLIDYYGQWDWCMRFERGIVWSYMFPKGQVSSRYPRSHPWRWLRSLRLTAGNASMIAIAGASMAVTGAYFANHLPWNLIPTAIGGFLIGIALRELRP